MISKEDIYTEDEEITAENEIDSQLKQMMRFE